ncbi:flippase activity-associated protein Agl23 [Verrucomicrobiota bacterium sgz303538]
MSTLTSEMSTTHIDAEQAVSKVRKSSFWVPALIITLAFLLRIIWLGIKPPHFDEGVNGWFVDQMTRQGYYHYDPGNFHGPLHFYVLFVFQTLFGRDVSILRLPIVLVSTGCVAMMFAFRRYFDRAACSLAALAMAVSPGMTFYGRYSIHESWLLLFLLMTAWGILGLWTQGERKHLWSVVMGATGMILTKETYAIHLVSLLLAFPALWILERVSPSSPAPYARQHWTMRDLLQASGIGLALIVFFYTGALLDWPDFRKEFGTVGSLAGLWETFAKWAATGTGGATGHEKHWAYWLDLLSRYEWPAAAGLLVVPLILRRGSNRLMRYLVIAGMGTMTAYSIIAYKTPWCLIVMIWPFLLLFGQVLVSAARNVDRWVSVSAGGLLLVGSLTLAGRLNFRDYTNENEPYVYVQTLPDIDELIGPLHKLTRISPAFYHLRGYILLPESDSHPLPWLLAPFSRVEFLNEVLPPSDMAADFMLVEDAIVSDLEEKLQAVYFKEPFVLRGSWGNSATLYLKASTFGPMFPGRTPDFDPKAPKQLPEQVLDLSTDSAPEQPPEQSVEQQLPPLSLSAPVSTP